MLWFWVPRWRLEENAAFWQMLLDASHKTNERLIEQNSKFVAQMIDLARENERLRGNCDHDFGPEVLLTEPPQRRCNKCGVFVRT